MVTIRRAALTIHGGPGNRMTILLSGQLIHLGRRLDNDIVIDDGTVSRRHAVVEETPYGFALRDLGSANGTYVNGGRVGPPGHLLRHGDRIHVPGCDVTVTFQQEPVSTVLIREDSLSLRRHDWRGRESA